VIGDDLKTFSFGFTVFCLPAFHY